MNKTNKVLIGLSKIPRVHAWRHPSTSLHCVQCSFMCRGAFNYINVRKALVRTGLFDAMWMNQEQVEWYEDPRKLIIVRLCDSQYHPCSPFNRHNSTYLRCELQPTPSYISGLRNSNTQFLRKNARKHNWLTKVINTIDIIIYKTFHKTEIDSSIYKETRYKNDTYQVWQLG